MALAVSLSRSSFLDDAQATQVFFYYGGDYRGILALFENP